MAFSFQSTGYHQTVNATLKCVEHLQRLHATGARDFDNANTGRIAKPHRPGQVSSGVGTVATTEGQDLRVER
jgi:hypothetical protein